MTERGARSFDEVAVPGGRGFEAGGRRLRLPAGIGDRLVVVKEPARRTRGSDRRRNFGHHLANRREGSRAEEVPRVRIVLDLLAVCDRLDCTAELAAFDRRAGGIGCRRTPAGSNEDGQDRRGASPYASHWFLLGGF